MVSNNFFVKNNLRKIWLENKLNNSKLNIKLLKKFCRLVFCLDIRISTINNFFSNKTIYFLMISKNFFNNLNIKKNYFFLYNTSLYKFYTLNNLIFLEKNIKLFSKKYFLENNLINENCLYADFNNLSLIKFRFDDLVLFKIKKNRFFNFIKFFFIYSIEFIDKFNTINKERKLIYFKENRKFRYIRYKKFFFMQLHIIMKYLFLCLDCNDKNDYKYDSYFNLIHYLADYTISVMDIYPKENFVDYDNNKIDYYKKYNALKNKLINLLGKDYNFFDILNLNRTNIFFRKILFIFNKIFKFLLKNNYIEWNDENIFIRKILKNDLNNLVFNFLYNLIFLKKLFLLFEVYNLNEIKEIIYKYKYFLFYNQKNHLLKNLLNISIEDEDLIYYYNYSNILNPHLLLKYLISFLINDFFDYKIKNIYTYKLFLLLKIYSIYFLTKFNFYNKFLVVNIKNNLINILNTYIIFKIYEPNILIKKSNKTYIYLIKYIYVLFDFFINIFGSYILKIIYVFNMLIKLFLIFTTKNLLLLSVNINLILNYYKILFFNYFNFIIYIDVIINLIKLIITSIYIITNLTIYLFFYLFKNLFILFILFICFLKKILFCLFYLLFSKNLFKSKNIYSLFCVKYIFNFFFFFFEKLKSLNIILFLKHKILHNFLKILLYMNVYVTIKIFSVMIFFYKFLKIYNIIYLFNLSNLKLNVLNKKNNKLIKKKSNLIDFIIFKNIYIFKNYLNMSINLNLENFLIYMNSLFKLKDFFWSLNYYNFFVFGFSGWWLSYNSFFFKKRNLLGRKIDDTFLIFNFYWFENNLFNNNLLNFNFKRFYLGNSNLFNNNFNFNNFKNNIQFSVLYLLNLDFYFILNILVLRFNLSLKYLFDNINKNYYDINYIRVSEKLNFLYDFFLEFFISKKIFKDKPIFFDTLNFNAKRNDIKLNYLNYINSQNLSFFSLILSILYKLKIFYVIFFLILNLIFLFCRFFVCLILYLLKYFYIIILFLCLVKFFYFL